MIKGIKRDCEEFPSIAGDNENVIRRLEQVSKGQDGRVYERMAKEILEPMRERRIDYFKFVEECISLSRVAYGQIADLTESIKEVIRILEEKLGVMNTVTSVLNICIYIGSQVDKYANNMERFNSLHEKACRFSIYDFIDKYR